MARKSCHPRVLLVATENSAFGNSSDAQFMRSSDNNIPFTATLGWPMYRSGSITAISCAFPVTAHTNDDTITVDVRVNNSAVFSATSDTVTATGVEYFSATQASDTDRFVAGDFISVFENIDGGNGNITVQDCLVLVELEYDD